MPEIVAASSVKGVHKGNRQKTLGRSTYVVEMVYNNEADVASPSEHPCTKSTLVSRVMTDKLDASIVPQSEVTLGAW